MKLINKFYNKNDVDYQVHEFLCKNGIIKFYSIDPFDNKVIKIPIRKSVVLSRINSGHLLKESQLSTEQIESLEWSKEYFENLNNKGVSIA